MSKKSIAMLTFLFWMIVALIFLSPACAFVKRAVDLSENSLGSYSNLMQEIIEVDEDELVSMPFSMNRKSVVVGFSAGMGRFENYEGSTLKGVYVKPVSAKNGCKDGKACVCICNDYQLDKDADPDSGDCEDVLICTPLENIDILSEKEVTTEDYVSTGYTWKGGFLIHRDISDSERVNGLEKRNIETRTIYVERYRNIIDVCLASPCLTDDNKAYIDSQVQNQ
jgi:hypothetical protein